MKLFSAFFLIFVLTNQNIECKKNTFITICEKIEFTVNPDYIGKHNYTIYKHENASSELDINAELLQPFYNNVTFGVEVLEVKNNGSSKTSMIKIEEKFCKALKNPQLMLIVRNFSNLPKQCPLKDFFQIRRLELIVEVLPKTFKNSNWILRFKLNQNSEKKNIVSADIFVTLINTSLKS